MVAAVATDDPDTAANIADAPMLVCNRPPDIWPSQSESDVYMRSVTPLRSRISPSRMKSGTAVMMKSLRTPQVFSPNVSNVGSPR